MMRHGFGTAVLVGGVVAALILAPLPAYATCGGGGGGGLGGATGGDFGPAATETYHVPWVIVGPADMAPGGALALYWFPSSAGEARESTLAFSRPLALASARCVAMVLFTSDNTPVRTKYHVPERGAAMLLVDAGGVEIGKVDTNGEAIATAAAERLLAAELDKRENAAKAGLILAKDKLAEKDAEGAAAIYTEIASEGCLLPDPARKAAKALRKMGRPVPEGGIVRSGYPDLSEATSTRIVRTMNAGLAAEREGRIDEARRLYAAALRIDPADPVPARFLGELLRHHVGDWDGARALFERVLEEAADPISRAVALHGLGKMAIHDGRFAEGLALFQRSLDAYPLALTYRNLAVYWNSEKDHVKAHAYVQKALAIDPDDPYNLVFAATYFVELGRPDEARAVARRYGDILAASYNLAVIYSQLGEADTALSLLERHFEVYERFDAVRAKEMQEARDDAAFAALHDDPRFVALTARADGDRASYHRHKS